VTASARALARLALAGAVFAASAARAADAPPAVVRIASKSFTESIVLGEIAAAVLRADGFSVEHRRGLGGTQIVWNALRRGEIDVYPEYTGTLEQEILAGRGISGEDALRTALAAEGVALGAALGFDDTYALGMREERAERLSIRSISDLRAHPGLRLGFTNEFMDRADGWPALRARYALRHADVRGLEHDLAYRALAEGTLDVTDLYSTDADIAYYGLRVLQDDLRHFPAYRAVLLYAGGLEARAPGAAAALERLAGAIDEATMIALNARVKLGRESEAAVAADFVREQLGLAAPAGAAPGESRAARIARTTLDHLALVATSLAAAIAVALPLGVLAAKRPRLGAVVLGTAGVLQTVPSLALLVFMIPLLGIGAPPAVAALFLYSLLPIVRNTHAGLHDIPDALRESAEALGLPPRRRLLWIELPLASRAILAGVKTSAVINVGTATLGALVGAGGYGQPILTGIRLDDVGLILEGAVPAALLALAVQALFDRSERWLVPAGLRLAREVQLLTPRRPLRGGAAASR
jgi:osmoprotectant transport system permease protein